MASPRLAVLAAVLAACGGVLAVPVQAAPIPSPTPTAPPSSSPTASPSPSASPGDALARLTQRVRTALRGSTASHPHYKITVAGVGTISHSPNRASAPASNEKLFTTTALLEQVGPDYRYVTRVGGTAAPVGGVLAGDLVLVGSGDPTFTHHNLNGLAKKLRAAGVRRVTGRLIVDDSRYSHATRAPGWKHDFLPEESGAVDAFSVDNDNQRSGASYLADPTAANAALWRSALKKVGIRIAGRTHLGAAPAAVLPLVQHRSRPLSKIVKMTLSESINYYAEMMLRELGYQTSGHGTRKSGIAGIRQFADRVGLPLGRVEDGSGLSYRNRETPGTFIAWLAKLVTLPPAYRTVYDGLAVSCKPPGTLRYRMCGPHVKHKVHAKTGTLTHITSLSGYTETAGGRFVTFSFLFSGARSLTTANNHIDAAVGALVRFKG